MSHNVSTTRAPLRAAIYARVSSDEQREGQTIDSQIAELEHFLEAEGWLRAGLYKDDGWSGALLNRPELDRLRDDASKNAFDVVVINDVDRLARDVSHVGVVKRDLARHGVQIVFRKLPAGDSPANNLMVNILASFAEFERELIKDRTRRGRRYKVEVRQQYLGSNTAYGYRYTPKDRSSGREGYLELVADEAVVVKRMFEWVDGEGLSARKVLDRLNAERVPTRKGRPWGKSSVVRILRNEMYAGVWYYNKHECRLTENESPAGDYRRPMRHHLRRRDRSEWLPVRLPKELQIVSRDQWERVQDQLDRNVTYSPRNGKHNYLLRGLVRCGACGARYVGDPCHGGYSYRCLNRCKRLPMVAEHILDEAVWGALEQAALNPEIITDQVERLRREQSLTETHLEQEITTVAEGLARIAHEENRLVEAYRLEILTTAKLREEMERLTSRREALEARRAELRRTAAQPPVAALRRSVREWLKLARRRLRALTFEVKQRFLQLLVSEIVFEGNQVRIRGVIPFNAEVRPERPEPRTVGAFLGGIASTMIYRDARNTPEEFEGFSFELVRPVVRPTKSELALARPRNPDGTFISTPHTQEAA